MRRLLLPYQPQSTTVTFIHCMARNSGSTFLSFSHTLLQPNSEASWVYFPGISSTRVLVPLLLFLSCPHICLEDGTGLAAAGQSEHVSLQEGTSQKRVSASCSSLFRLSRTGKAKSFHSYETQCLPGLPSHCAQVPNFKPL